MISKEQYLYSEFLIVIGILEHFYSSLDKTVFNDETIVKEGLNIHKSLHDSLLRLQQILERYHGNSKDGIT